MKQGFHISGNSGQILRGVGSTMQIAPRRVIVIGGTSTDGQRIAGIWRRVGNDMRRAMTRSAGSGK